MKEIIMTNKWLIEGDLERIAKKEKRVFKKDIFWTAFESLYFNGGVMEKFETDNSVTLKREDLTTYGSHKHHAIRVQLAYIQAVGQTKACVSSSGNCALTSLYLSASTGIEMNVWVSDKTQEHKLKKLENVCAELHGSTKNLHISAHAQKETNLFAVKNGARNMRPSLDPVCVVGFELLALDIYDQWKSAGAWYTDIITFSTSGASYVGMYNGFSKLLKSKKIPSIPRMHLVRGHAGNLGSHFSPLMKKCSEIAKTTNGQTLEITEDDLMTTPSIHLDNQSPESTSSLLAYDRLRSTMTTKSHPIIISSGSLWI